jgi:hypothetical protein
MRGVKTKERKAHMADLGIRTRTEVERLKHDWKTDGTWDIEETPGFEEHYEELLAFRKATEEEQEKRRQASIARYTQGVPDELATRVILNGGYGQDLDANRLTLSLIGAIERQTKVQERIAAALERHTEVKPWEK